MAQLRPPSGRELSNHYDGLEDVAHVTPYDHLDLAAYDKLKSRNDDVVTVRPLGSTEDE